MILTLLSVAFAGSIELNVESSEGASPDYVDFGQVANRRGPPPAVGRKIAADEGTFLVVDVMATAHWVANVPEPSGPLMYEPVLSSDWVVRRPAADLGTRSIRRRANLKPTISRPLVPRGLLRTQAPVTRVDLYARNTSTVGGGTVWYAPEGSNWTGATQVEIGSVDTLIARDVPVDQLFRHQLGMWVPEGEAGLQIQRVVYTAMIP